MISALIGVVKMKRANKKLVAAIMALAGGMVSSCTTNILMPTRDAAIAGLTDFVNQTVYDILFGFVITDSGGA